MSMLASRSSRGALALPALLLVLAACDKRVRTDDPNRRGGAGAAVPGVPAVPPGVGVNADTQTLGSPYGVQDNTKPPPPETAGPAPVDAGAGGAGGAAVSNGAQGRDAAAGAAGKK